MFSSTKIMQALSPAAAAPTGYQIARSLRFNQPDSAYLNRTLATPTSRRIYTSSSWIKRSGLGVTAFLSAVGPNPGTWDAIRFDTNDTLSIRFSADTYALSTTQVFRDVSSWYHIVIAVDTTQATSSNRVKVYVNGVQVTAFSGSYPVQNLDTAQLSGNLTRIGSSSWGTTEIFPGYMAETYFIDGQALDPTSFGEFDANTGVWSPIAYTGTYGTNGFYLNFSDNSGTTSTTLGKDYSGNGNNWTPNNFSVTAGTGNDSLVDTPTNYGTDTGVGGEVRGNYCTLNPLDNGGNTLTDGNLSGNKGGGWSSTRATMACPTTGKWYWEAVITAGGNNMTVGIATNAAALSGDIIGRDAYGWGYVSGNGQKWTNGSGASYGATWTAGDIIGIAFDADAGTLTFYKNNTSQGTAFSSLTSGPYFPGVSFESTTGYVNFGQRPFAYTAPSGFKALCTQNLPTPTIGATSSTLANKNFDATLYTGTGAIQSITNSGAFQPDFVWLKVRNQAYGHALFDSIRGSGNGLQSNSTNAEVAWGSSTLSSFNSNGFSLGADTTYLVANSNANTFVGWQWKGGGTAVTNTSGSISSQVSANPTAGISVVTFVAPASGSATIGHGLGVAPSMIILKSRAVTSIWATYHKSVGATGYLALNSTAGTTTSANAFNNTAPTSTVFTIGTDFNGVSGNYLAYCFAEVAGFSKISSYVGNGSSDGPFVYCGFRPRFVIVKNSSDAGVNWLMFDTSTNPYNVLTKYLLPNLDVAEQSDLSLDILSNGFKPRVAGGTGINSSGSTYIFIAFAEAPFNYSRAR